MANFDIIMPKMGESIEEATITNWFVKEGDMVEEDDVLLEIATDKVDSEIPSPVEGVIKKIFFRQDEVVAVGTVIAVIGLDGDDSSSTDEKAEAVIEEEVSDSEPEVIHEKKNDEPVVSSQGRFYSPLVRTIAGKEGVSQDVLDAIEGSGLNGRVRKEDLLKYLENRGGALPVQTEKPGAVAPGSAPPAKKESAPAPTMEGDEVIEMSRLR
ncbi:MAG: E3 binding domain-containing protein, partial [Bacteroidales bacterium]|nr:E3 binding domain-containing protein [Bacteroidales bacterium]